MYTKQIATGPCQPRFRRAVERHRQPRKLLAVAAAGARWCTMREITRCTLQGSSGAPLVYIYVGFRARLRGRGARHRCKLLYDTRLRRVGGPFARFPSGCPSAPGRRAALEAAQAKKIWGPLRCAPTQILKRGLRCWRSAKQCSGFTGLIKNNYFSN